MISFSERRGCASLQFNYSIDPVSLVFYPFSSLFPLFFIFFFFFPFRIISVSCPVSNLGFASDVVVCSRRGHSEHAGWQGRGPVIDVSNAEIADAVATKTGYDGNGARHWGYGEGASGFRYSLRRYHMFIIHSALFPRYRRVE